MPAAMSMTSQQKIAVEFSRVSLFILVLAVALISFLLQPRFINWGALSSMYLGVGVSLAVHLFYVARIDRIYEKSQFLLASFVADSIFISVLIYGSGQNQSLFMFLHLANIMLSGFLLKSRGASIVALFTSLGFSAASIFSVELKGLNYAFLLILNNMAFFLVAGMSGYLSDQLYLVGQKLALTGEKLKDVSELNEAIIENSPLGIVTFDSSGRIFQKNPEIERIFGPPEGGYDFLRIFEVLRLPVMGETVHRQLQVVLNDGLERKDVEILIRPLSAKGGLYVALVEDRTGINKLEERARQNEKLAAIGGLAAGIAHEIRNPLAGISGSIQMLSQTTDNGDDQKLMNIVLREIDRLNNLITEFLDYAKPEKTPTENVNLSHLLGDVVEFAKKDPRAPAGLQYAMQIEDSLVVKGDGGKLKQVFLNIIINAQQAMIEREGGRLEVSARRRDRELVVTVKDNGSGMSPETRKRIFEPFFTTKSKGTGLGLAMTYKILQSHHAKVVVESEKGKGTVFEMIFTLAD